MPTAQQAVSLNSSRILPTVGTPPKEQWHGIYAASCVQNNDPLGQGRITMYVPQVLGMAVSNWAKPLGFGNIVVPVPGQMVHAYFLGGDVNQPVYACINLTTINNEISAVQNSVNNLQTQVTAITPGAFQTLSLNSSWGLVSGYMSPQIRLINSGMAQLAGTLSFTAGGGLPNGQQVAYLPNGYFFTSAQQTIPVVILSSSGLDGITFNVTGTTDTNGLSNSSVGGTSGTVNGGTAGQSNHTHSAGGYGLVAGGGLHFHTNTSNGQSVAVTYKNTNAYLNIDQSGTMTIQNASASTLTISFNAMVFI